MNGQFTGGALKYKDKIVIVYFKDGIKYEHSCSQKDFLKQETRVALFDEVLLRLTIKN